MREGFAEPGRAWQRHGQAWQGLAPLGNGKAKHCLDMHGNGIE